MILVTGGTGFIGKSLVRQLVETGYQVRTLIRPSKKSPDLPLGFPLDVTVSSLSDESGLRASMVGVDTVYHLIGGEWKGPQASLLNIDIQGTQAILKASKEASVKRFIYISHLGAERASAYPVLKAKAIAEEFIRQSGLKYTIFRTAIVYGPNDGLTTGIARITSSIPFLFIIPGDGEVLLQPIWVEDLTTCLTWILDYPETANQTFEIGGPEYLQFRKIVDLVCKEIGIRRSIINMRPPYLRAITVFLESVFPNIPVSVYWLDYLASNRTCTLDTLPRVFNLMPSRFSHRLSYLKNQPWRVSLIRSLFSPRR
jgi:NADH dehydrogenase